MNNILNLFSNNYVDIELNELSIFWFNNPKIWFNCTIEDDILIKKKYTHLVLREINNKTSSLPLIILYDQLVRHIYRGEDDKIQYYLNIALYHVKNILPNIEEYGP